MGIKRLVESRRCLSFLLGDNSKLRNRKGNPNNPAETVTEFREPPKEPENPERSSEEGATRQGDLQKNLLEDLLICSIKGGAKNQ